MSPLHGLPPPPQEEPRGKHPRRMCSPSVLFFLSTARNSVTFLYLFFCRYCNFAHLLFGFLVLNISMVDSHDFRQEVGLFLRVEPMICSYISLYPNIIVFRMLYLLSSSGQTVHFNSHHLNLEHRKIQTSNDL